METFLSQCSNLCDTVIKELYGGVAEDRFEEMHSRAMEKCWKSLEFGWKALSEMHTPGARLFSNVKNVLIDYWRGEFHRKNRTEKYQAAAPYERRYQQFDPVAEAQYNETESGLVSVLRRKSLEFRLHGSYGEVYDEIVSFYHHHQRSPTRSELVTLASPDRIERLELVAFQAAVYHFHKHLQLALDGVR